MQKRKNESGITFIALIITIALLLILAGTSINASQISMKKSKDSKNKAELSIVQDAILTQYQKAITLGKIEIEPIPDTSFSNKPDVFVGEIIKLDEVTAPNVFWVMSNESNFKYFEDFYYRLNKENLSKIGLTNTENQFIVNYKTGEVYNETIQKDSNGNPLYVKSLKLPVEQEIVDTTFSNDE